MQKNPELKEIADVSHNSNLLFKGEEKSDSEGSDPSSPREENNENESEKRKFKPLITILPTQQAEVDKSGEPDELKYPYSLRVDVQEEDNKQSLKIIKEDSEEQSSFDMSRELLLLE